MAGNAVSALPFLGVPTREAPRYGETIMLPLPWGSAFAIQGGRGLQIARMIPPYSGYL